MSYGLPYKGSKNVCARTVCSALPAGKRLVDLFAGGCAVTDCALREFSGKWKTVLANDANPEPVGLYAKCLCGECPVSDKWVGRDDFPSADWATRLIWSFGNDTRTYLYGRDVEPQKRRIHEWIVSGAQSDGLPALPTRAMRYDWTRGHVRHQSLESLERLERLERLEGLERLEISVLDFRRYAWRDGDVVYCDIPYESTACGQYSPEFDRAAFLSWALSVPFGVYVSERTVPDGFRVVATIPMPNRANRAGIDGFKTEYLLWNGKGNRVCPLGF